VNGRAICVVGIFVRTTSSKIALASDGYSFRLLTPADVRQRDHRANDLLGRPIQRAGAAHQTR
jgi:hypothetical protein